LVQSEPRFCERDFLQEFKHIEDFLPSSPLLVKGLLAARMENLSVLLILIVAFICQVYGGGGKDAQKLYNKLFRDYNTNIRPVSSPRDTLDLDFGLSLVEVLDIDDNGHATLNTWMRMSWTDAFLKWNEKDYGVGQIHVAAHEVWLPDVILYNSADTKINKDLNVIVYKDGTVTWVAPAKFTVTCKHEFRGNLWVCPLRFGSWTFDGKQINLQPYDGRTSLDTSDYNGDRFTLVDSKGERRERKYECCPQLYPSMEYIIKVRAIMGQSLLLGRKK